MIHNLWPEVFCTVPSCTECDCGSVYGMKEMLLFFLKNDETYGFILV
jgi:hypothetical protein